MNGLARHPLPLGTYFLAVATALFALPVEHASAQGTGTVVGTITDSATGAPLRGALATASCSGCLGRHPTDSAGRFAIERIPAGAITFESHCPSANWLGAEILRRDVVVVANAQVVVNVTVPPGTCAEPAYSERRGTFRGFWTPGFESSRFRPCADARTGVALPLLPGKRLTEPAAWADLSTRARAQQLAWPSDAPRDAWGSPMFFVEWVGVLKGPGRYGHLGVTAFRMEVDSVISVRSATGASCEA